MTKRPPSYMSLPLAADRPVRATHLNVMRAASPQAICPHCYWPVRTERRRFLFWTRTVTTCRVHGAVSPLVV